MTTVGDVIDLLERTYPLPWAESWDKVGMVWGERDRDISTVLCAIDPTVAVAREAVDHAAGLLITHHPLLLKGASFLPADHGKGAVLTHLIRGECALWCGHTNVDRSWQGTVGAWSELLELKDPRPLIAGDAPTDPHASVGSKAHTDLFGLGVVGELPAQMSVRELATVIAQGVPATAQGIRFTGADDRSVSTVAVCPGSGDSFLDAVTASGADAYVTSDLRHHPALEHLESKADPVRVPALIDVAHSASESLWLPRVQSLLSEHFPQLAVHRSQISTDPWAGRINQ